jgi:hypothetical protein
MPQSPRRFTRTEDTTQPRSRQPHHTASTPKRQPRKLAPRHEPTQPPEKTVMAKGQMRSNREKKKPKATAKDKKSPAANQPFATKPEPARVKK